MSGCEGGGIGLSAEERKKRGKGRVDEPDKNIRSGAEAVRPELRSG